MVRESNITFTKGISFMNAKYLVKRDGVLIGEFDATEMKELAPEGKILPSDLIQKVGSSKWVSADSVSGLSFSSPEDAASPPSFETEADPPKVGRLGRRRRMDPSTRSQISEGPAMAEFPRPRQRTWPKVIALLIGCGIGFGVAVGIGMTGAGWYDYGNGLVNLDRVTRISGNWSLTWSQTMVDDDGEETELQRESESGSLNATTATDVRRFVASAPVGAKFSGNSIVRFDLFQLTLSDFKDRATPEAVIEEANLWLLYYAEIKKQLL